MYPIKTSLKVVFSNSIQSRPDQTGNAERSVSVIVTASGPPARGSSACFECLLGQPSFCPIHIEFQFSHWFSSFGLLIQSRRTFVPLVAAAAVVENVLER